MEISIIYIIKNMLMPPGIHILSILFGLLLINKFRKTGKLIILLSTVSLYLLSTAYVSRSLAGLVETTPSLPPVISKETDREAIIILGGGRRVVMPEYGKPIPYSTVLERLRYAMHIQRQTQLPILITGGHVFPKSISEAEVMNQVLIDDFQFEAKWLEQKSRNTAQNANFSYDILNKEGINKIYLVTHSSHMNRAVDIFTHVGFDITPAPTIYNSAGTNMPPIMQWLPKSNALELSRNILHEMLGYWWYQLRHH